MKNKSKEYYRVTLYTEYVGDDYEKLVHYTRYFFFDDLKDAIYFIDFYFSYHICQDIFDDYILKDIELEYIRRIL